MSLHHRHTEHFFHVQTCGINITRQINYKAVIKQNI
uniref:Uncharacterized protein n=1 Tax=Anguilla anguilla TaxID=7936 RepID=A0A0E9R886_ANGAN